MALFQGMKFTALALLSLSLQSSFALAISFEASATNPLVRVRMETKIQKIKFEAVGLQIQGREKIYDLVSLPHSEEVSIERLPSATTGQIAWKLTRAGRAQLIFERYLMIKSQQLRKGGQTYPKQMIFSAQKNSFDVIGVLPLENYLVGVVASEMPSSWPIEALKAQAIAARSYTLVSMRERANKIYHIEGNVLDQVFTHLSEQQEASGPMAKAKEAVQSTAGIVLLDPQKRVLKAYYHSDCGGKTSNAANVWGFGGSTGSAVDSWCPANPKAHWSFAINSNSLSQKLQRFAKHPLEIVMNLIALRPSANERVEKIKIQWQDESGKPSEEKTILAAQFREAIGFEQMRSTFFDLQKKSSEYVFVGRGFGHGVGLCQWGARSQAQAGRSYMDILQHYYPQAHAELYQKTKNSLKL